MQPRQGEPPTGTVTFLFSDIEGSTQLVRRFGDGYDELLGRHRAALRGAFGAHAGWEHSTEGDSFFVIFPTAADAVAAAAAAQRALAESDWPPDGAIRVRMGLHSGEGRLSDDDYVGLDVHRAARIAAAGHGGQVLLSESTHGLVAGRLADTISLRDLGLHRLKDLPAPEHLYQLVIDGLPDDFPALRSLGRRVVNLPESISSLIGRAGDVDAVLQLVREARLVTVTGPSGTGKTRLVQEVARTDAGDGIEAVYVPLEAVRDSELIETEILQAIRLDVATSRTPHERVLEYLSDRKALLVLDNLEQLDGAPRVVRVLLESAPDLRVLASSQASLHVPGEQEYALTPLAVTGPGATGQGQRGTLDDSPAVRLFVERARAVRRDFAVDDASAVLINEICARLDGLPLAIELAAAQVKFLSPAAILARIQDRVDLLASRSEDVPERHRTLTAAIRWSYELLADEPRRLLRRLSVFAGGAAMPEIEAVAARAPAIAEPLSALSDLVDRSLVVVDRASALGDRMTMLETIHSVGRDLLRDAGEEPAAVLAHAATYRELAAKAESRFYTPERRAWLDRLSAEQANLRAAMDELAAAGDLEAALGMAADLWRFWQARGHLLEGRERVDALLATASAAPGVSPAVLSRAFEAAGNIRYWMRTGGLTEVEALYRRSLEAAQEAGDARLEAWAKYNLAFMFDFAPSSGKGQPDPGRAELLRREALETFRAIGDRRGIGHSLWAQGSNVGVIREDPDRARELLGEASAVLSEIGDEYGTAWVLGSTAFVHMLQGELEQARAAMVGSGRLQVRANDTAGMIVTVQGFAALAALSGDPHQAVRLAALAATAAHETGADPPEIPVLMAPIAEAQARLSPEDLAADSAAGAQLSMNAVLLELIAASDQSADAGDPPATGG